MTLEIYIAVISLVLSCAALVHTYVVNKSFAKNQLIIDQVKSVNELVNYLNRKKIEMKFCNISGDGSGVGSRSGELTIFELLKLSETFTSFDDDPVLLDSNKCNEVFEFIKFINDPLIPSSIAKELSKFISGSNFQLKINSDYGGNNIVLINSRVRYDYNLFHYKDDELKDKLIAGNAIALKSWLSFKTCCGALEKAIYSWYKSKSINDLNIRTEFQHY